MPEEVAIPLVGSAIEDTILGGAVDATLFTGGATSVFEGGILGSGAAAATGAAGSGILESLKSAATVLSPVASLVSAASGVSNANKMSKVAPNIPGQLAMPIAGSPVATLSQQNSFVSQLQRRGRASTILTSPDGDKLGN